MANAKKGVKGFVGVSLRDRFFSRVKIPDGDGCWIWTGITTRGYGMIHADGRNRRATHVSWLIKHGKYPTLCMCHKCDNPPCVNPDHLWEGTRKQNMQDAVKKGRLHNGNRKKTHCKHGHEFVPENTYMQRGGRNCIKCRVARTKEWRRRVRDSVKFPRST